MTDEYGPSVCPASTLVRLHRTWDAALERTARLRPATSHAALVDWQPDIWPADGGLPTEIAQVLGRVLVRIGFLLARTDRGARPGPMTRLIPIPRRTVLQRLRDRVLRRWPDTLALTGDATDAAALLDDGWAAQGQLALVLTSANPPIPVLDAARLRHDWRDFRLTPPILLLAAPANDGDGILLAAPSAAMLHQVLASLRHEFLLQGFKVDEAWRSST